MLSERGNLADTIVGGQKVEERSWVVHIVGAIPR